MKPVQAYLILLLFLSVPRILFWVAGFPYPYRAVMYDAAMLAAIVSVVYHFVLIQPGGVLDFIPRRLEQWAYNRTLNKFDPDTSRPTPADQARYYRYLFLLKPYRECPECLAGQLGIIAFLSLWPLQWVGLLIPFISITCAFFLATLWKTQKEF